MARGYNKFQAYHSLQESVIDTLLNKTSNYIGNITNNFRAIYVYRDNKFEKSI